MIKPIITLQSLKIVNMLGMLTIILSGIRVASDIIVPFILALFIAVALNPIIERMTKAYIPRVLAIIFLIGMIIVLVILLAAYLGIFLNEIARTLPKYRSFLVSPLLQLQPFLRYVGIAISTDELIKYIDPNSVIFLISKILKHLSSAMTSIFFLLLTVIFMLLEVPYLPNKLLCITNRPIERIGTIQFALSSISRYLVLKTVVGLAIGLMAWCMLVFLHVRFAFIWGLLAFVLNYIPNIGPAIASIFPVIQVLILNGLYKSLIVLTGYLVINLVFGNIFEFRIIGYELGLSTLCVFLSLIFWGWLLGVVGALLSVPLTIIFKIVLEQNESGRRIAVLLSNLKTKTNTKNS